MQTIYFVLLSGVYFSLISAENTTKCNADQKRFEQIIQSGKAVDVFYFVNDTKETIQLTWAGENSGVLILVTMTEGETGPGLTSDIYRSENNGKTFAKITHELGEKVYIRRENGLQRHQNQRDSKELFVVCYDIDNKQHSVLFVTKDGGSTWERSAVPFLLSGQLRFYPRRRLSPWILTLEERTSRLYISLDNGKTWSKTHENVVDYFWSIYRDDPEETFYVLHKPNQSKNDSVNQILSKTTDFGTTWTHIMDKVVRVWAPRGVRTQTLSKANSPEHHNPSSPFRNMDPEELSSNSGVFLYVAHYNGTENQTTQLSVSKDGGKSFKPVYLPMVQSERFFSVLEVEDDLAFLHVDAPNDTGYGTLFTSDSSGQIFTESLRQHLYPNHAPITDFYRVASMRGTYLATRLNPDRTLHTVITHDRGASWRALGAPLNVDGACNNDASGKADEKQSTPISTATFSKQAFSDTHRDNNSGSTADSFRSNPKDALDAESVGNDSLAMDPSAIKVCGLQISNQFSIRNRVTASAPLSIAAAPGLILAHGHVATHLKNTPADVFVSSDGGYTWIKALDGPHHYQIANRGGLLVAVPADTLWPDVLRFSTDEGRCWHTIPLRAGAWNVDHTGGSSTTAKVSVYTTPGNTTPTLLTTRGRNATVPPGHQLENHTSGGTTTTTPTTNYEAWIRGRADETVVFTGLVTEPGGRAMAAAVYGYGTVSQRWRVAVVDFTTNGMVTTPCTNDDYEIWTPHSGTEGAQDGCLLGVKQYYKRLRKDSLCINEYGMEPLVHTERCKCTRADYECEFAYYRQIGTLECIQNPHVPLINLCEVYGPGRELSHNMEYRRIPGDQCVGGWQPPQLGEAILSAIATCGNNSQTGEVKTDPGISAATTAVLITIALVFIIVLGSLCYRRTKRFASQPSTRSGIFSSFSDELNGATFPWRWKVMRNEPLPVASNESLWPPTDRSMRWSANHSYSTNGPGSRVSTTGFQDKNANSNDSRSFFKPPGPTLSRDALSHFSHMKPWLVGRFRQSELDGRNLLDAEEIATPTEPSLLHIGGPIFHDPLSDMTAADPTTTRSPK
ncbi:hypothetical protein CRM22_009802 [Opisthorchis felineus]|uniref:VPS10 domain-containing protein n=1 Tax=Opisthorchis felineus TaxID=147828 RepID=A0A4S2LBL8_OPIFE|nr:hypothetical protein CRM22_009802 [Opisthorchis felineus]